jgi:hypothetical protein
LLATSHSSATAGEDPAGTQPLTVETVNGTVLTRLGPADRPDAVITGTPQLIAAVLAGKVGLRQARVAGLESKADPEVLRRVQPLALILD